MDMGKGTRMDSFVSYPLYSVLAISLCSWYSSMAHIWFLVSAWGSHIRIVSGSSRVYSVSVCPYWLRISSCWFIWWPLSSQQCWWNHCGIGWLFANSEWKLTGECQWNEQNVGWWCLHYRIASRGKRLNKIWRWTEMKHESVDWVCRRFRKSIMSAPSVLCPPFNIYSFWYPPSLLLPKLAFSVCEWWQCRILFKGKSWSYRIHQTGNLVVRKFDGIETYG